MFAIDNMLFLKILMNNEIKKSKKIIEELETIKIIVFI